MTSTSLQRQLAEVRENLRIIEEQKAKFVLETEVPLTLIKEERRLRARLAELEQGVIDTLEAQAARARYLASLRERYGVVQTHAFMDLAQDQQVGQARQLPLLGEHGVYVPLWFESPVLRAELPEEQDERQMKRTPQQRAARDLIEPRERERAFGLADVLKLPGHLAIIGDAGAGKTTLLHLIVTALAVEDAAVLPDDLIKALPHPRPLPVLLPLRQFELACTSGRYARTLPDLLRFVDEWFAQWCDCGELPADFLAAHIRAGRAWLLLDALDEVADPDHRVTVRNVIQTLARDYPQTRLIVTARVAGYKGATLNDHFTVVQVRDLDEEQRSQMIRLLYGSLALHDAARQADDLIGRFNRSDALRDLGRTPVMVWTAAIIHALRRELPEGRAALYDAYVDILLKHSYSRGAFDVEAVKAVADSVQWPLTDRRHYLSYAAFEVHRLLESQPDRQHDKQIVIGEDELADTILARYFRENLGDTPRAAKERARDFVSVMVAHSGLLYETSQGYTIGDHLTMQEFLAGCYLAEEYKDADEYAAFLRDKVGESWWREVFTLAAGYLATRPGFAARNFLRQIAQQGNTPERRLIALTLATRGLLQLRVQRPRPNWYDGLARDFAQALYTLLYGHPIDAPIPLRHEAGLALGLLHDESLPDPRFAYPQGLPDFKRIEAGWFWMGSTDEEVEALIKAQGNDYYSREKPRHRVYVDAFDLARFPTTNVMYARFIADDGYANPEWWGEAIKDGYWQNNKVKDWTDEWYDLPRYWNDAQWNNPSQPVVGVNWYEAVAYCNWLTATLNDGHLYRLPTEAEWERAARGVQGFSYPWGPQWMPDFCNSKQANLGVTSAVGVFYKGATLIGLEDMAGNVWEWCADWYGEKYYVQSQDAHNPIGPDKGDARVLRGGSWYSAGPDDCRCGSRDWFYPWYWSDFRGFRCARISPS